MQFKSLPDGGFPLFFCLFVCFFFFEFSRTETCPGEPPTRASNAALNSVDDRDLLSLASKKKLSVTYTFA